MNQKYVIATSTKVSMEGVDVSTIDDIFFARDKKAESSGDKTIPESRKAAQVTVDTALVANIQKVEMLEAYIKAKFTLKNGDKPYLMNF